MNIITKHIINNNMTEQQTIDNINEIIDRFEARLDIINEKLDMIVNEIDKHKNEPSKTITSTYDGEIMFKYKTKDNEK